MSGRGLELETAINRVHRGYIRDGRAWCWHTFPPFILQQRLKGGRFIGRLMGEAPPNYLIFAGGRFLMVEAKSIKSARFPWSNLKPHQARQLSICDGFDQAAAVLAIRCEPIGETVVVLWRDIEEDWGVWRTFKNNDERAPSGAGSIAWGDLRDRALVVMRWPEVDYLDQLLEALSDAN